MEPSLVASTYLGHTQIAMENLPQLPQLRGLKSMAGVGRHAESQPVAIPVAAEENVLCMSCAYRESENRRGGRNEMGLPWRAMTVAAVVGSALLVLAHGIRSRRYAVQAFATLWLAQFVAWLAWSTLVYPSFLSPLRHLPQPKGAHWLFGHGKYLLSQAPGGALRDWITTLDHDGLIRYLFFFNRERVLVSSPKALAEVLVTKNYQFPKPDAVRNSLGRVLGFGVLLAEGDEHKRQRRKLMPAFHFRHIKGLYPTIWRKAREVVLAMEASLAVGAGVLEVNSWASRCTLDIIGVAGMGFDFGAIQDEHNPLAQTYINLARPSRQARYMMLLAMVLPGWCLHYLPLRRNSDLDAAAKSIRNVCRELIVMKKQKLAGKEPLGLDIVTVALESGLLTDDQLVDQLMTFLAAGHDTTASALTWSAYLLSKYPDVQERVRAEVREMLPSVHGDSDITSADIDRMPYLNAFCSEVLRVYCPVPQTIREAACDTTIQGQAIPKGTRIMLSPWGTNMDRRLWGDDAADFRPERWLTPSGGTGPESNFAFMTFLQGPRSCMGAAFARAEMACLVAAWVGRFAFSLDDTSLADERMLQFKASVTLRPAYGMHLRTRVVDGW
ncbi:hypothetical protein RJ55_00320 [Drechmeria coniospora]|nr:hypothetical protein RJ55_00320 [Drechmeria coniospora]